MPLYEYKCRLCGNVREVRHGFKESFSEPCIECGGEMARVFTPAGIVFKGSGFYVNDSRKPSAPTGSSKAKDSEAKPSTEKSTSETSSSEKSSDTKTSSETSSGDKASVPKTGSSASTGKSDAAA